ncbi:hypothetical protein HDU83_002932 [Entophlyctis luteolus]|nr:hypothetical protein HDU83_002932 [Entophlyctis luteolus]
MDDVTIITDCMGVYRSWLLDKPEFRPPAVISARDLPFEQLFYQNIFKHVSLLFQPRKSSEYSSGQLTPDLVLMETSVATQVNLCKQILAMLLQAAQQQQNSPLIDKSASVGHHLNFSRETWVVLLKVMLGCCERLLAENCGAVIVDKSRRGSYIDGSIGEKIMSARWATRGGGDREKAAGDVNPGSRMGDALCDSLSRTLFEIWLRSEEMGTDLWACLQAQYEKWTHRIEVVRNWSAVILALTDRVIQQLYGELEGQKYVTVTYPSGGSFCLDLNETFVVYSWHRLIYIIGDVNSIESPEIFHVAIKGISKVIDEFCAVGTKKEFNETVNAPDGNTLLKMFGKWLFEAVSRKSPEYEDGISEAYATLCKIFSTLQPRNTFLPSYLYRFYASISVGLRVGHPQTLTAIMVNCQEFFIADLQGSRVLLPDFAIALNRVLPTTEKSGFPVGIVPMDELRRACLKILSGMLGVLSRFPEVSIRTSVSMQQVDFSDKIKSFYPHYAYENSKRSSRDIGNLIPDSVITPTVASLKPFLLDVLLSTHEIEQNAINIKIIHHILVCFALEEIQNCPGAVSLILEGVIDKVMKKLWSQDIQSSAFELLSQLSFFWAPVDQTVKGTARKVVVTLCAYIESLFVEDNVIANQQMIIRAYDTMIRWALVGGWMENDTDTISKINMTLCRGISILAPNDEFSALAAPSLQANQAGLQKPGSVGSLTATGGMKDAGNSSTSQVVSPVSLERPTLANQFAVFAGTVTNAIGPEGRRLRKEKKRAGTMSSPLANLVATVTVGSTTSTLDRDKSMGTLKGGNSATTPDVGVSTFAKLTAKVAIKAAAETALAQMLNHLGNFPPKNASFGVTRISTLFDEITEVKRILDIRDRLMEDSIFASSSSNIGLNQEKGTIAVADFKKFLRYFVFDNRVLLGFVEQPEWAMDNDDDSIESNYFDSEKAPRDPKLIIVIRDSIGKFSWKSELKYIDDTKKMTTKENQPDEFEKLRVRPKSAPSSRNRLQQKHESIYHNSQSLAPPASTAENASPCAEYHVYPKLPPYIPPNAEVVHGECFNEQAIPKFSELVPPDSEEGKKLEQLKVMLDKCIEEEQKIFSSFEDNSKIDTSIRPTPPVDRYDPNIPVSVFRQFLSHMGYLDIDSREKLKPMVMSESFLKDLERMDSLQERECFGINVLYVSDCQSTINDIINPQSLTTDFCEFLHSIGWAVRLETHVGYRGPFTATTCETVSYFASRNVEIVFNTPYLLKIDEKDLAAGTDEGPTAATVDDTASRVEKIKTLFTAAAAENHSTVIWIENMIDVSSVVKRVVNSLVPATTSVVVVHPRLSASGVYDVRVLTPNGTPEENLAIGPLIDGTCTSKLALGDLVRMTAQSGHMFARTMKSTYRKPQTARRLMIEEICNRHKLNTTMSG